jgi:hypothetical protein
MLTTIANITDEDVIHCFQNGLASKIVVELHDMMQ